MKKIPLHISIFLGMFLGIAFGYLFPQYAGWVHPLGLIFLKLLKMIVIPLIFVSIVDGINQAGSMEKLSKLGGKTVLYYMATTALAVATSLILVNLIHPGTGVTLFGEKPEILNQSSGIHLMDFIPGNMLGAFVDSQALQIILIALMIGMGMVAMGERVGGLRKGFAEANALLMKITSVMIDFAPVGIFGLMANMASSFDMSAVSGVFKFVVTILAGLGIHALITLPIIFKIFSGRSLTHFVQSVYPALFSAFSTASSSATLPITLDCVEEREGISKETAGFVLPVGATVNMDGTAMYEAVACMFIAQALGVDMSFGAQLMIFFTATLAAVGAAAIPSAGLITLAIVLTAVKLPLEGIGFLLAFDRPLDMCRTTVNVWGDMVGCAVVEDHKSK